MPLHYGRCSVIALVQGCTVRWARAQAVCELTLCPLTPCPLASFLYSYFPSWLSLSELSHLAPFPHLLFFLNPLGLLSFHIPHVEPRDLDFSNSHGAVNATPPAPTLVSGDPWYPWYSWKQPPERELSRLRRQYQGHLREESGPPPESMPEVALTIGGEASTEHAGS